MCVRVFVCVPGQNYTNQFVNWQPGIFNLVVITGCQNPIIFSNTLYIYVLINEKRVIKRLLLLLLLCHQAGAYPGFRSMKRLGVFLLPPGWNVSSSQGYPQQ